MRFLFRIQHGFPGRVRPVVQGRLYPFLLKAQPRPPDGLLADVEHLADLAVGFALVDLEQNVRQLDHHGFITTFRDDS